jgi:hypothetical protein
MSQDTFIISTHYILSAIKKDGTRVYYDTDDRGAGGPDENRVTGCHVAIIVVIK